MLNRQKFLMEAMGEPAGVSRSAMAYCSAIIEDAEMAREFQFEPRGPLDFLCTVMPGSGYAYREAALSPRELTSLIA